MQLIESNSLILTTDRNFNKDVHDRLLKLLDKDQKEYKAFAKVYHIFGRDNMTTKKLRIKLLKHSHNRAIEMQSLLGEVIHPKIHSIGADGIEAASIIALHSNISIMKTVLSDFLKVYKHAPSDMNKTVIPALVDRISILQNKKQVYGTQWLQGSDGLPFLYPVKDFQNVNTRRKSFGLEPIRRPRIVALIKPGEKWGPVPATQNDQRFPTKEEYEEYANDFTDEP